MEATGFEDQMFNDYSPDGVLSPLGPSATQHHIHHHHYVPHQHHHHQAQAIMIGSANGDKSQQHQRLPAVHQILPGSSPKMESYKLDYGQVVKLESGAYSPNGKEYLNGTTKLESYSPGEKLDAYSGQYSPNAKIIQFGSPIEQQIQMFHQPQPVDGNHQQQQQQNIINGLNGSNNNFKRKSDENLNNLSGSPTPISSISTADATSTSSLSSSPNKKPVDKKKNDANGVKKKKTR